MTIFWFNQLLIIHNAGHLSFHEHELLLGFHIDFSSSWIFWMFEWNDHAKNRLCHPDVEQKSPIIIITYILMSPEHVVQSTTTNSNNRLQTQPSARLHPFSNCGISVCSPSANAASWKLLDRPTFECSLFEKCGRGIRSNWNVSQCFGPLNPIHHYRVNRQLLRCAAAEWYALCSTCRRVFGIAANNGMNKLLLTSEHCE